MAERFESDNYVATAKARFLRIAPIKARYVADLIRGRTVRDALNLLAVTPKPSAIPEIQRLLISAVSNVNHKEHPNTDDLRLELVYVDGGPTAKRIQPHAMGRAFRIRKRTCHITIGLA